MDDSKQDVWSKSPKRQYSSGEGIYFKVSLEVSIPGKKDSKERGFPTRLWTPGRSTGDPMVRWSHLWSMRRTKKGRATLPDPENFLV